MPHFQEFFYKEGFPVHPCIPGCSLFEISLFPFVSATIYPALYNIIPPYIILCFGWRINLIGQFESSWHGFLPFTLIYQQSTTPIVGSVCWPFINCCKESKLSLNIHVLGIKLQLSWFIVVSLTFVWLKHGQSLSGSYFHLYLVPFFPQKLDAYVATQIWKNWGTLVVVCSKPVQSARSKALVFNNPLS